MPEAHAAHEGLAAMSFPPRRRRRTPPRTVSLPSPMGCECEWEERGARQETKKCGLTSGHAAGYQRLSHLQYDATRLSVLPPPLPLCLGTRLALLAPLAARVLVHLP